MKKFVLIVVVYFISHTGAFVLEYIYQRWCYPMTIQGFLASIFTSGSPICKSLRTWSQILDTMT